MIDDDSRIQLPDAPEEQAGRPVAAWYQDVVIDTYRPTDPGRFPLYLDSRVYQGSSGRVYPLPFHERIEAAKTPVSWRAIHLENAWLRLMILPDLGGRIHIGLDKTRDYDFFYRNNVIKPALVGLAGPWVSGGVEFNWPQHHRPATFLPVDTTIEHEDDGSVTVWCSDLDPFDRLKGMHGIRLRPDSASVEMRVRLFNRTEDVQTFLWWANVAAAVNSDYQSFFPGDVAHVADHAKRAIATFPRVKGQYYGVDYAARVDADHPDADRLDWYRNIPVPTSYMCVGSKDDFFGGYDHGVGAGFVHWADHHVSPGKKQWTWGNAPFGQAWDRNLTDADGPYIELMAGVYTDNQPDFTFLAPGETKSFSQWWYPIQDIGAPHVATRDLALRLDLAASGGGTLAVAATAVRLALEIEVLLADEVAAAWRADVAPGTPWQVPLEFAGGTLRDDLTVLIRADVEDLLRWSPGTTTEAAAPVQATEPPAPEAVGSVEELYLIGAHLEQYRHATRSPEPYWREALDRDPSNSRVCVALAARRYRTGLFGEAETLLRAAIARQTAWNPNPYDAEASYRLGLVLREQGEVDEAYDCWAKAAWAAPWRAAAWTAMARADLAAGRTVIALELARRALAVEGENLQLMAVLVIALRAAGQWAEADDVLARARRLDPLDWWLRDLAGDSLDVDAQVLLDVGLEYVSCGLLDDALRLFSQAEDRERGMPVLGQPRLGPLPCYHRARLLHGSGRLEDAEEELRRASDVDTTWAFPGRLNDATTLEWVVGHAPGQANAWAMWGHWLYAHGRSSEAISAWERGGAHDPVVARNLGMAAWNHAQDAPAAVRLYDRAIELASDDSRLLSERDQLARRCVEPLAVRLTRLDAQAALVEERDDLSATRSVLLALLGREEEALALLVDRTFQPWEGGEGVVLGAWELTQLERARRLLSLGASAQAEAAVRAALEPPTNLGEDRHPLANCADLYLALGDALDAAGDAVGAHDAWGTAARFDGDFQEMSPTAVSEKTYYSALAWRRLGDSERCDGLREAIEARAALAAVEDVTIDYFATSLPNMLLFIDDPVARRRTFGQVLTAQAALIRGSLGDAVRVCEQVLRTDPGNIHAHALVAHFRERSVINEGGGQNEADTT